MKTRIRECRSGSFIIEERVWFQWEGVGYRNYSSYEEAYEAMVEYVEMMQRKLVVREFTNESL